MFLDNILSLQQKELMYSIELRDKFNEICRADLISRVLNKSNNNLMLLRKHLICKANIGKTYFVYNGFKRVPLFIKKNMVGFKVGEFVFSKKIKNMSMIKNNTKLFNRYRSKKKNIKLKKKKQQKYIINLKNKLVNLKKIVQVIKKELNYNFNKRLMFEISKLLQIDVNNLILQL